MKFRILAGAAAAIGLLAISSQANAVITITSMAAAPGDAALGHGIANGGALVGAAVAGQIMIDNFGDNGGLLTPLAGFAFNPTVLDQDGLAPGYIRSGPALLDSESAPPPVWDVNPAAIHYESGNYYTVSSDCVTGQASPTGCTHSATLIVTNGYLHNFSFYLGSPDTYNSIAFFTSQGQLGPTLSGNAIWACPSCAQSGFQGFGARAIYDFGGAQVTSVVFTSGGNSFEFDNLAGTVYGVPEPTSWALMILGLGGVGAALRSRRRTVFA